MRAICKLIDHSFSPEGKMRLTVELDEKRDIADLIDKVLDLELKIYREKRSLQANRMMWACIGELAAAIHSDKDAVHDLMLRRYGTYTYQIIKPQTAVLERFRAIWEGVVEDKGQIYADGIDGRQILLIYPSRYYDTKEFSRLLDGIISEMKEAGIETPEEQRIREAMEEYERMKPWQNQSSKKASTA